MTALRSTVRGSNVNPCPSGLELNTIIIETMLNDNVLKNITYLICDNSVTDNLSFTLLLSFGLGIPVALISFIVLYRGLSNRYIVG